MKSYNVIFRNGHFYNIETNERIIPVAGKKFVIAADNDAFQQDDELLLENKPLLDAKKIEFYKNKYNDNIIKLLDKGRLLYFRLGLGTPGKNQKSLQYVFECKTNDDLYIYLPLGSDKTDPFSWRLLDCSCYLTKCIIGGLTLTDTVTAKSLNQLFQHTVMFYFSMQRSGSCNPFKTYFLLSEDTSEKIITIDKIYANAFTLLDQKRITEVHNKFPVKTQIPDYHVK